MAQSTMPPVPQRLRELLNDYPELIERLQHALNRVIEKPVKGTPLFEIAVWTLEDELSALASEAHQELKGAEASENVAAVESAKAKERLVSHASSKGTWISDEDLWDYFQANKEAF